MRHNVLVPTNYERAFAERPEVLAAWVQLNTAIKAGMDLRRYELATVAAARRLRSSYCTLAHGTILMDKFLEPDVLQAVVDDHRAAGLDAVDVAVMDLADKVAHDATSVDQADVNHLRSLGLSDTEILDVVAAAAARAFFSKMLDGLGARRSPSDGRSPSAERGKRAQDGSAGGSGSRDSGRCTQATSCHAPSL
jgi:uncharacterized peroxidase-related enzyme